jgi:O-antigen/teichoic acid export membrane protein
MLARSVTLNFLGSAASLVIGFVGSVLLARWLGPTDRGLLGALQAISASALTLTSIGVPMAVLYYASRDRTSTRKLLGTSFAQAAVLAAILVPAAAIFSHPLARAFSHGRGGLVWVLAAALVPITFLDWTTHNQILARLQFGFYNTVSVVSKVVTVVLIVVLVGVGKLGVAGGLLALGAASVVMVVGCLPPLLRDGRPQYDGRLFQRLTSYGVRVQLNNIFQNLNYRLDVIILQFFRPLSDVGYYVVAQIIAELVTVLAGSFQSSIIPLVAGSEGESRDRTTILAIRHHGILAATGCVLNAGFGTALIVIGYGSAYRPAIVPMLILLPGIWWLGTGSVVTSDLRARDRPGLASAVSGAAVLVTVGLDLALIPPLGIIGAAIASVVAYTVQGILSLVALSRVTGLPVRTLVVPERSDLAAYPAAARTLARRLRGRSTPTLPEQT